MQIITFILGFTPLLSGFLEMLGIYDPLYNDEIQNTHNIMLDSNLRFFNGVWLGMSIVVFSIIKNIETHSFTFRIVLGTIFLGGIGRLLSMIFVGLPDLPFIGITLLEILGVPFFMYWQRKVANENIPSQNLKSSIKTNDT